MKRPYRYHPAKLPAPIEEPDWWPDDGGSVRKPVIDPIDCRVVRRAGWLTCLCCPRRFLSPDVVKRRICDYCHQYGIQN